MARTSLTDTQNMSFCYMAVTPGNGFAFGFKGMWNGTQNGNGDKAQFHYIDGRYTAGTAQYPCYLKLVKKRNPNYTVGWEMNYVYSGYYSLDGKAWTLVFKHPLRQSDHNDNVGPFVCPKNSGTGLAAFDYYRTQAAITLTGSPNTIALETGSIGSVGFNQASASLNKIRFKIRPGADFLYFDTLATEAGTPEYISPAYTVMTGQAGPPAKLILSSNPSSIRANGTTTAVVTARVTDIDGYTCNTATNTVNFSITGNGTLISSLIVQAVNGLATVTMRSTATPGSAQVTGAATGLASGYTDVPTYGNAVKIGITMDKTSVPANGVSSVTVTASVLDSGDRVVLDDTTQLSFVLTGAGTFLDGTAAKSSMLENGRAILPVISKAVGTITVTVTGGTLTQDSKTVEALQNYRDGVTIKSANAAGETKLVIAANSMDQNVNINIRTKAEIDAYDLTLRGKLVTACKPASQSGTIPDADITSGKIKFSNGLWDDSIHDFTATDVQTTTESNVNFNPAATIVIPYSAASGVVTGTDIPEDSLAVYFLNETNDTWEKQASTVNTATHEVSASVTHLSAYCLMGGEDGGEVVLGTITNMTSYPNPFNPASGTGNVKFIYNLPSAGDVRIEVFTLAGKLVRTLTDAGALAGYGEISWNGTDDDGTEIANGLYLYKMTLTSSGSETSKIGKLAKIR